MPSLARWAADLVMILVTVIWALNNVVMKVALGGWATPEAFNALRFSLGAVLLAIVVLRVEGSLKIPGQLFWKVALLGLIGNGLNQMLFVNGLARGTASNAGVWLGLVPVLVALISGLFRLDRITPRIWTGALISSGGILTVIAAQGNGFSISPADLFFAGAVTTWAGYTVFSRPLVQDVSPLRVTAVAMLVASAGLLLWNGPALMVQDFAAVPRESWLGLLYAGGMSNAVGYSLYVWCVRRNGPARVALYNNLGPVLTAAGAWYLLDEPWGLPQSLGVALVITGVAVARWDDLRRMLASAQQQEQRGA